MSAALGMQILRNLCPEGARERLVETRQTALCDRSVKLPVPLQGTIFTRQQTQGGARLGLAGPGLVSEAPLGRKQETAQLLNLRIGLVLKSTGMKSRDIQELVEIEEGQRELV